MKTEMITTPVFQVCSNYFTALHYARAQFQRGEKKIVIKASGLAGGKGSFVCDEANVSYVLDLLMKKLALGTAGNTVVIQQFVPGFELSCHALCDGNTSLMFPLTQDHKQRNDGGDGLNTGGMGCYGPVSLDHLGRNDLSLASLQDRIVNPLLAGMRKDKRVFQGLLYPGLIVDREHSWVIEVNARFGDPETEVYAQLFEDDIVPHLLACAAGKLSGMKLSWKPGYAVSVALVGQNYPDQSDYGTVIEGIEDAERIPGIVVFHGGTAQKDGHIVTHGGRILHVTGYAETLDEARSCTYRAVKKIHFNRMHYRKDIATTLPS